MWVALCRLTSDRGQDKESQRGLCTAGQVFRSLKTTLLGSRRVGLGSNFKFYKPLIWCCPGSCTVQHMHFTI